MDEADTKSKLGQGGAAPARNFGIAVSGATSLAGLTAIRDLRRAGMEVVGLCGEPAPLGLHSRWSELLDRLDLDALFPLASWLVRALVPVRDEIDRHAALNIPDPTAFAAADDGWQICMCAELGIPAPRLMEREFVAAGSGEAQGRCRRCSASRSAGT